MADDYTTRRADAASRMARLGDLHDFEVADGYPDIRGWKVVTADGALVGKVKDLIVDTAALRTRYIDLVLADELRKSSVTDRDGHRRVDDREVLLPVGAAQLDDRSDVVRVAGMSVDQIVALPLYDEDALRAGTIAAAGEPLAARGPVANETVIERRPVVWEEVVVQRRRVTDTGGDADVPPERADLGRASRGAYDDQRDTQPDDRRPL